MEEITKRRLKFLAGFAVYFGVLWFLWNTPFVYPLKIIVVLLHEISHGLVAVMTGGGAHGIWSWIRIRITVGAPSRGLGKRSRRSRRSRHRRKRRGWSAGSSRARATLPRRLISSSAFVT